MSCLALWPIQCNTDAFNFPSVGALIVLESILGRPIDLDSIPLQAVAKGVTPGGTVDLAGAGVHPELIKAANERAMGCPANLPALRMQNLQEEEEEDEAMLLERERALAELMGGGPLREMPVLEQQQVKEPVGEGREIYNAKSSGGFLQ